MYAQKLHSESSLHACVTKWKSLEKILILIHFLLNDDSLEEHPDFLAYSIGGNKVLTLVYIYIYKNACTCCFLHFNSLMFTYSFLLWLGLSMMGNTPLYQFSSHFSLWSGKNSHLFIVEIWLDNFTKVECSFKSLSPLITLIFNQQKAPLQEQYEFFRTLLRGFVDLASCNPRLCVVFSGCQTSEWSFLLSLYS